MISSIYEIRACPECAGSNLSYIDEHDQVVCRDCGLVYEPLTPSDDERLKRVSLANKGSSSKTSGKKVKPAKKSAGKKPAKKSSAKKKPAAKKGKVKRR